MNLRTQNVVIGLEEGFGAGPLSLLFSAGTKALVVGHAGTGKTSLLKLLAGLRRPSHGRVFWDDRDIWSQEAPERRRGQSLFGMIFQQDALFDSETVLENVMLPLLRRGVARMEAESRAWNVLQDVRLSGVARRLPEELSGGMRKRVGIARAVAARPQVLLADEPFAGLDPETSVEIAQLLFASSVNKTLVLATSDIPDWLRVDNVFHLKKSGLPLE